MCEISIILPIYNNEKYLERCVLSIVNQTYKNIEIILIDDGSTDKSRNICDKYSSIDSRIRVIHKTNAGVSSARNCGIDIANGKYLMFVDSDDYIEENMCEILYKNILENNIDICACFFKYRFSNKIITEDYTKYKDSFECKTYNGKDFLELLYKGNFANGLVVSSWNKIYKKELFEKLRFKEGIINEDDHICAYLYDENINIKLIPDSLYIYFQAENSITRSSFSEKRLIFIDILEDRANIFGNKKYEYLYFNTLKLLCNMCIEYYFKIKCIDFNYNFSKYKKIYNKSYKKSLTNKNLKFKDKIRMGIFYISPNLYKSIIKINKGRL